MTTTMTIPLTGLSSTQQQIRAPEVAKDLPLLRLLSVRERGQRRLTEGPRREPERREEPWEGGEGAEAMSSMNLTVFPRRIFRSWRMYS